MKYSTVFLISFQLCFVYIQAIHTQAEDNILQGRVSIPPASGSRINDATILLYTANGDRLKAFCDSYGEFVFENVTSGSHILHVHLLGFMFPEVQVDISRRGEFLRAFLTQNKQYGLSYPIHIRPVSEAPYYEKRKPFDIWSLVKSPYGIMIVISVFAIFVFPMMKVDPEEYKEYTQSRSGTSGQQQVTQGQQQQSATPRIRDR